MAHMGGVPMEELLPTAGGAATGLLVARAWLMMHVRRPRDRDDDPDEAPFIHSSRDTGPGRDVETEVDDVSAYARPKAQPTE
jgi:hypothetical protein